MVMMNLRLWSREIRPLLRPLNPLIVKPGQEIIKVESSTGCHSVYRDIFGNSSFMHGFNLSNFPRGHCGENNNRQA